MKKNQKIFCLLQKVLYVANHYKDIDVTSEKKSLFGTFYTGIYETGS